MSAKAGFVPPMLLLKTDKYRQQIAEALYSGVIKYQQSLKRVPAIATK